MKDIVCPGENSKSIRSMSQQSQLVWLQVFFEKVVCKRELLYCSKMLKEVQFQLYVYKLLCMYATVALLQHFALH